MPNLSERELTSLRTLLAEFSPSLALALAEQVNADVTLEADSAVSVNVLDAQKRVESVLYTVFVLSHPYGAESVFSIPRDTACVLFDLMKGNDGMNPPDDLSDEESGRLHGAMQGVINGLANALTLRFGELIEVEACNSHLASLSLPPSFALNDTAAQVNLTLTIPDVHDGTATFLFSPEWVQTLFPPPTESGADDIVSADDLASMLNDIGGFGAPAPRANRAEGSPKGGGSPYTNFPPTPSESHMPRGMELILDIPLDVTVELGRVRMLIKDVLELSSGSIVELDRVAGEPVDLLVNGRLVAKGEVVVIEDNFGIRITEIVSPADRVSGLRGR